jgi:hypothetical protein
LSKNSAPSCSLISELLEDSVHEAEFKRREKRQAEKPTPFPAAHLAIQRLTQRTVRFIRWLRNHLDLQRDWDHAIAKLARSYSQS